MTDLLTENARLRAALDEREANMLEWLDKISYPTLAQYPRSMARNYAERLRREMAERAALATPAYDTRADWLWYGIDTDNRTHVTFGRLPRLPCQKRYRLADIQPVEHDHPAPAPDAVQEAARVPEIAALIEAVRAEIDARNLYLATAPDRGGMNGTKGRRKADLERAQSRTAAALRAIAGDRT